ncbi:hypothetical protein BP00DRAFT_338427, partial [Aspergillus indologenus CBS 114.80]
SISTHLHLPPPSPDEIIVRSLGGALNPHDWKFPHLLLHDGDDRPSNPGGRTPVRLGCDFHGVILALGPAARTRRPDLRVGDRVCGVVFGANPGSPATGAFADYVVAKAELVVVLGPAAARAPSSPSGVDCLPGTEEVVAWSGAAFLTLSLALRPYVLVYGASTATGTIAVQLLRLSGYLPLAICSPSHFDLVRSRGAEAAFDYHAPTSCVEAVRRYLSGRGDGGVLSCALDIIADDRSQRICAEVLGAAATATATAAAAAAVCVVLGKLSSGIAARHPAIRFESLVAATGFGVEVRLPGEYYRAADPAARAHVGNCFEEIQAVVRRGAVLPHPHEVLEGGYVGVLRGLDRLRRGQVRGRKLVYLRG